MACQIRSAGVLPKKTGGKEKKLWEEISA